MFHVALVKIPVSDIPRAAGFYGRLLDMAPTVEAPEFGWAHFEADAMTLALYVPGQGGGDRPPGGTVDFQLLHPDLPALAHRVGPLDPEARIHDNADGSRSLEITDPDGNVVKVMGVSETP